MKIVLDTNVLASAMASRGLCEAVFEICLNSHEVFLSEYILTELARYLERKRKLPAALAKEAISFVREQVTIVTPLPVPPSACRDASDLPILGTALAANADCIITGDSDLLEMKKFASIAIQSPRVFHDSLR